MANIISQNNFNPANLTADGLYIEQLQPPTYIRGVPTSIAGIVGTASWGRVNQPIYCGNAPQASAAFGSINAASLTDPYDLPTDMAVAFQQGQNSSLAIWGVRVTDGTDVAASTTLMTSGSPVSGVTLSAVSTGTLGNQFSATLSLGARTNTTTVAIVPFSGLQPELYPNLPNATFWTSLVDAITSGISNVRGPSSIVTAVLSTGTAPSGLPALGTFNFTGGTDGRTGVTAATLIGQNLTYPFTGLQSFSDVNPPLSVTWMAGVTDQTQVPSFQSFLDNNGTWGLFAFPTGTSTADAVTQAQALGVEDGNFSYCKDSIYWYDPINSKVRLLLPYAFIGGRTAALGPQFNPGNTPVYGVLGTERNNPYTGTVPYSNAEIGELANAGVMFISNPCPGGAFFGIREATTTALMNPALQAEGVVEYARMTNFLSNSLGATMGLYVDKLQGQGPNDPLRQAIRQSLKQFLNPMLGSMIDDYLVTCEFSATGTPGLGINTPQSIAQHFLYAMVQVRYLSSVRFFVLALQGGTTVVTSTTSAGGALA